MMNMVQIVVCIIILVFGAMMINTTLKINKLIENDKFLEKAYLDCKTRLNEITDHLKELE